jgi:hypothetical protein
VAERDPSSWHELYQPRFDIDRAQPIATAGSCFAQHIGAQFRAHGYAIMDVEPAPRRLSQKDARRFGYSIFSARHGNIYTARQLLQLTKEALGEHKPEGWIWRKGDSFIDGLRPGVEPDGLSCPEEVEVHRKAHLDAFRSLLTTARLFVFTFGLTEAWEHRSGTVFPLAPGTSGGEYDPAEVSFRNFQFNEVRSDFLEYREIVKSLNREARFLLTVSPVPLAATATDQHVLAATTYSKSVLRAVAGDLYTRFDDVDYFPSYEIISTPFSRQFFFDYNLRDVTAQGVEIVMRAFFEAHGKKPHLSFPSAASPPKQSDVICEEALLEAFAP